MRLIPVSRMDTKETWYRIEKREHISTKATLQPEQMIMFKRYVARAGYKLSPTDMPMPETNEQALSILATKAGVTVAQAAKMVLATGWEPRYYDGPRPPRAPLVVEAEDLDPSGFYLPLRRLYYQVRGRWADTQSYGERIRTFWYQDLEHAASGQIDARVVRQVGRYYAGHAWSGSCWDDDYDPPGLDRWITQVLYRVHTGYAPDVLVHPLDVITKENDEEAQ